MLKAGEQWFDCAHQPGSRGSSSLTIPVGFKPDDFNKQVLTNYLAIALFIYNTKPNISSYCRWKINFW
jgi:hypothetical protein